jgi:hypothetical protein
MNATQNVAPVTLNVAAMVKSAKAKAKANGTMARGKRGGTKVRKGVRQMAASEIVSVIEAASGKTARDFAGMLAMAQEAVANAERHAIAMMATGDIGKVATAMAAVTAAKTDLSRVTIAAASKSNDLADAIVDERLAKVASKVLASWNAYLTGDNDRANRIGSFHDANERATVRAGIVAMLEAVVKVIEADKVGEYNGFRA